MQQRSPATPRRLADLRRLIAEELRRQLIVPEDQIEPIIDQILDAMKKAKAEGRDLDEVELTTDD
jgi:hypothetical protein